MDTETQDTLAWHHTLLVGWLVGRVAFGLLAGALTGLVIGGVAWNQGSLGWVVASPGVGLVVMAVVLTLGTPPEPPERDI